MLKPIINKTLPAAAAALLTAGLAAAALAGGDIPVFKLVLKDHQFQPQTLSVPAEKKFKLVVLNQGAQPAEFESVLLHREQVVVAGSQGTIYLGPLKEGRYEFFDDFHNETRGFLEAGKGEADGR